MRRRIGLWWVPLLLLLAPLADRYPAHRDLVDFFAPMRAATFERLARGEAPWLNPANGCGEAWFANPETAVLYPPAWLYLVLPTGWGLAAEIALHLAWLSLGAGLLAVSWGAGRGGRLLVEAAAWSVGPVLSLVGVVNNLDALAWLPWMVLAATGERQRIPRLAASAALAWLAGEPQIWALAVLATWLCARRWRTLAGLALGLGVAAVQVAPFAFWVAEGDRGLGAGAAALRGGLEPIDWLGLLAPLGRAATAGRVVFAESLLLGGPLLLCAVLGARRRRSVVVVAGLLALVATLPALGAGGVYLALTGGLVRFPARFALVGLVALIPLAGRGADEWLEGRGRLLAALIAVATIALCWHAAEPYGWLVAGAPAGLLLVAAALRPYRWLRTAALVAGVAGLVAAGVPLLGLASPGALSAGADAWCEARGEGRLYTLPETEADVRRLSARVEERRWWPLGYTNLGSGITLVRSHAPILNRRLATHLSAIDRGPVGRWWLDSAGARLMLLPHPAGETELVEIASGHGLRLVQNLRAVPVVTVARRAPLVDAGWQGVGALVTVRRRPQRLEARLSSPRPGWLWVNLAPVRGWRWSLDGRSVALRPGPGVVSSLPVPAGLHYLEGRYRPPLLWPASATSLVALALVLGLGLAGRRHATMSALE